MDTKLIRLHSLSSGIFSNMTCGEKNYVTASHAYPTTQQGWEPKVPPGTYTCTRYFSPDHGYDVFVINGVPPFQGQPVSMCEFHIGNFPQRDSIGCELLGAEIVLNSATPMVTESKDMFKSFMQQQDGCESFILTVE